MTQRTIDTMDIIIDKIAECKTLSGALSHVYKKRDVAIPFNDSMFNIEIPNLKINKKAINALMRAGLRTVNDVIKYAEDSSLKSIKNFGETSGIELLETILDLAWDKMTEEEKVMFLIDVVERNEENLRIEIM